LTKPTDPNTVKFTQILLTLKDLSRRQIDKHLVVSSMGCSQSREAVMKDYSHYHSFYLLNGLGPPLYWLIAKRLSTRALNLKGTRHYDYRNGMMSLILGKKGALTKYLG